MKIADIQLVAITIERSLLEISHTLGEEKAPGESPQQERKKPDQLCPGPASMWFVLPCGPVGFGETRIKHPGII